MIIAKVTNSVIGQIGDCRTLFPSVSFPESGPPAQWLQQNGYVPVLDYADINPENQVIEPCAPYLKDGVVYRFKVTTLTQAQIADRARSTMVVSPFQAKAALLQSGLLKSVEDLMTDPTTDPLIKLAWDTASEFRRISPAVVGMAKALGWTDAKLDEVFILARQIVV